MEAILQYVLYLLILVALAIPLGGYIAKVMKGDKVFLSCICRPCERLIYKVLRVDEKEEMTWKKYALSTILFSGIGLVIFFAIEMLQQILPLNPEKLPGLSWHLAFNTAASFVTNTNWQAYSGESALSYFTQATCLTVWNFVSAATGIAVLFVLIRGFVRKKADTLGSFWVDLTRTVVYILLPLSVVVTLVLVSQGVVQNLKPYETVS